MTSLTDALALYDTASSIDRLRFRLRALPPAPVAPSPSEVSEQVRTLAGIIAGISDAVSRRLSDGLYSVPAQRAVDAFSSALAPLGEAMTELGRLQRDVVFVHFTAPRISTSEMPHPRELATEVITECRDAAAEILEVTAEELRAVATRLTTSSGPLQSAARARSPHAAVTRQATSAPAAPLPAPSPAVAPTTAKGR